ncbi:MAG: hypothetical protein CL910_05825 [Deltaproteobacteria bacterium]|jgi:hypothetical protein|nr:hypothetical protein [Deltaproteobacteria bacterium]
MGTTNRRSALAAVLLACCMMTTPLAAHAESPAKAFGMGAATVFANLLYGPTKLVYATIGGLVASTAYAFSGGDVEVARPIVDAALRGDYFVTTNHLRGTDQLEFIGRRPGHEQMDPQQDWQVGAGPEPDPGF